MLSQKAKYTLKALLFLARQESNKALQISEIAEQEKLPKKFLEQILLELKRHNIVYSQRGKHGGYALAKTPEEISFGHIIRIVDGPLALLPCVSKTAYRRCVDCVDEKTCSIRKLMQVVRDSTSEILDNTTLADALKGALE